MTINKLSSFKKLVSFFFLYLIVQLLNYPITPAYAADEFYTSYQITYTVQPNAAVKVNQQVELTNRLANVYADQYQITLGTTKIRDVWARDGSGSIKPQIEKRENLTTIKLEFNQEITGKDEALTFNLGYTSDDYALKKGRVLEIGIPKISQAEKLTDYQAVLQVPSFFKEPIFIQPMPQSQEKIDGFNIYYFEREQLLDQSLTASFGESQIFDFTFDYHLQNQEDSARLFAIALPPDSPWQKVYYQTLLPGPQEIQVDKDGNWLAHYLLQKGESLDITASGSAEIYLQPRTALARLKPADLQAYLASAPFWPVNEPAVQQLAGELKTPEEIYDFVVKTLDYDYQRAAGGAERMGALQALENKEQAVCMEITDLFISLARAAGIPAREVNGYAYTANSKLRPLGLHQDVLHAWPEYYDPQTQLWRPVDPTWTKTTAGIDFFHQLDLNHFAFVFHGIESDYPYPPGAYKTSSTDKDIQVSFADQLPKEIKKLNLIIDLPSQALGGQKPVSRIKVVNLGNTAQYNQVLSLSTQGLSKSQKEIVIPVLPPLASFEEEGFLKRTSLVQSGQIEVLAKLNDQQKRAEIEVVSPLLSYGLPLGAITIVLILIFVLWLRR